MHSAGHEQRAYNIHAARDDVWSAYRTLYDKSRSARNYGATFPRVYVHDVILDGHLKVVKTLV